MQQTIWKDFYLKRKDYDFDTFIFTKSDFAWLPQDVIITTSEDVYDDDEVSECETPMKLFEQGYRFLSVITEIKTAYDDTWLHFGGDDTYEWFTLAIQNYASGEPAILPQDIADKH